MGECLEEIQETQKGQLGVFQCETGTHNEREVCLHWLNDQWNSRIDRHNPGLLARIGEKYPKIQDPTTLHKQEWSDVT